MTIGNVQQEHRVVRSGEGTDVGAIGLGIHVRLTGADTAGAYSLFEYIVPPGLGGPPTHVHSREDEMFTCTRGRVRIELDGEHHLLRAGDSLLLPRRVPHTFDNPFQDETRVVAVVSPPGLEDYYRELSELPPGPRDMELIAGVMARHGLSPKEGSR
ncbi:cupin domain-containing protein [Actinomadura welshii]|uniref:cupin domain-containing protein n=1 Tax=Actinomadura welshii TaxID=3103817 RepID=UPI0003ACE8DE|nr:cupin domain-containing protein [Actinomadura madurae]